MTITLEQIKEMKIPVGTPIELTFYGRSLKRLVYFDGIKKIKGSIIRPGVNRCLSISPGENECLSIKNGIGKERDPGKCLYYPSEIEQIKVLEYQE